MECARTVLAVAVAVAALSGAGALQVTVYGGPSCAGQTEVQRKAANGACLTYSDGPGDLRSFNAVCASSEADSAWTFTIFNGNRRCQSGVTASFGGASGTCVTVNGQGVAVDCTVGSNDGGVDVPVGIVVAALVGLVVVVALITWACRACNGSSAPAQPHGYVYMPNGAAGQYAPQQGGAPSV